MKKIASPRISAALVIAFSSVFALSSARAQQNVGDNLSFNNGNGGNGTWETGAAGTPWLDNGVSVNWDNSILTNAEFGNTTPANPGSVTVNGTVNVYQQTYDSNYSVTGGTIQNVGENQILAVNNNSTVSIGSDLDLDAGYNNDQFDFNVNGTSSLTLGNILYTNPTNATGLNGHRVVIFNTNGASTVNLTGTYSEGTTGVTGGIWLQGSSDATLELSGNYTGNTGEQLAQAFEGTILINTNNLGTDSIGAGATFGSKPYAAVLTNGAFTVNNAVGLFNIGSDGTYGDVTVGGATQDISTYTGLINQIQTQANLTAVAGGRVIFSGDIGGESNNGIAKSGAGTVVLTNTNDYNLGNYFGGATGTVVADIKQGTLLITNTSGSAFGNNAGAVKIEAGATLGGSGSTGGTQQVVAEDATSVIAPGDAGQASLGIAPTIATLTLAGGLDAANGLTMDFKLDDISNVPGTDSDLLTTDGLTLGGNVTINLSVIGSTPLTVGTVYQLIDGSGDWTGSPTFTINGPAGDVFTYDYEPDSNSLTIQLVAAPEPSTWAMLAGGLFLLAVGLRRRASLVG